MTSTKWYSFQPMIQWRKKEETGILNRGREANDNKSKKYTEKFKREAERLIETSGKPVAQIACDLGINDNNLYR